MNKSRRGKRALPSRASTQDARRHLANLIQIEEFLARGAGPSAMKLANVGTIGVKGCVYLAAHGQPEPLQALLKNLASGKLKPRERADMIVLLQHIGEWIDPKKFDVWMELQEPRGRGQPPKAVPKHLQTRHDYNALRRQGVGADKAKQLLARRYGVDVETVVDRLDRPAKRKSRKKAR